MQESPVDHGRGGALERGRLGETVTTLSVVGPLNKEREKGCA